MQLHELKWKWFSDYWDHCIIGTIRLTRSKLNDATTDVPAGGEPRVPAGHYTIRRYDRDISDRQWHLANELDAWTHLDPIAAQAILHHLTGERDDASK